MFTFSKLILVSNYAMECLHFHRKPENLFFITPLTNPENEISTAHIPEFRDIPEKWHV